MKNKKALLLSILLCLVTTGCSISEKNRNISSATNDTKSSSTSVTNEKITPIVTETPTINNQGVTLDKENDNMLGYYDSTQYFWRTENDNCVLYSLDDTEQYTNKIATFSPKYENEPESIIHFGVCGDWLIASVGHYEGSGSYFYGDFVRLKRDGSELAHFYLTDDDTFVIIDDWMYYNYWNVKEEYEDDACGCYRIHPDGTDKEYLGDSIHKIYLYENGSVYGEYATSKSVNGWNIIDFIRCNPDGSNVITLFKGDNLPKFDNSDYIQYYDIKIVDNDVSFTVSVHGQSDGDSCYGHFIYTAQYTVKSDGSNLTLLSEETEE